MIKHNKTKFEETYFYIIPSDWTKEGFTQKNLRHFLLKDWCFDVLEDEIKAIMKRLDQDQDGIVSCRDYANVILPLHLPKEKQIEWMHCWLSNLLSTNFNSDEYWEEKENKMEDFYKTCWLNSTDEKIENKSTNRGASKKTCPSSKVNYYFNIYRVIVILDQQKIYHPFIRRQVK